MGVGGGESLHQKLDAISIPVDSIVVLNDVHGNVIVKVKLPGIWDEFEIVRTPWPGSGVLSHSVTAHGIREHVRVEMDRKSAGAR